MAKLVIVTLEYAEARALLKKLQAHSNHEMDMAHAYREAVRKLQQEMLRANPLEKAK